MQQQTKIIGSEGEITTLDVANLLLSYIGEKDYTFAQMNVEAINEAEDDSDIIYGDVYYFNRTGEPDKEVCITIEDHQYSVIVVQYKNGAYVSSSDIAYAKGQIDLIDCLNECYQGIAVGQLMQLKNLSHYTPNYSLI